MSENLRVYTDSRGQTDTLGVGITYDVFVCEPALLIELRDALDEPIADSLVKVWGDCQTEESALILRTDGAGVISVPDKSADGGALQVRILVRGTPHPEQPGAQTCTDCATLQARVDDGTIAGRCMRRSSDETTVMALQSHLAGFGYPLGDSGSAGDGVDGKYAGLTSDALSAFIQDAFSRPVENPDALSPADARRLIEACAAGFRRSAPQQPAPSAPTPAPTPAPSTPPPSAAPRTGPCDDCSTLETAAAAGTNVCGLKDKSEVVAALQRHLTRFHFFVGNIDADYGDATSRALAELQTEALGRPAERTPVLTAALARELISRCEQGYRRADIPMPPRAQRGKLGDKVRSSHITVGGMHFVQWFNSSFKKTFNANYKSEEDKIYRVGSLIESNFRDIFDYIPTFFGKQEITRNEFIAHLFIAAREAGFDLESRSEKRSPQSCMTKSYNGHPNRPATTPVKRIFQDNRYAGELLAEWGVIRHRADISAWNSRTTYPNDPPAATAREWHAGGSKEVNPLGITWADVQKRAEECDFYKYRGRGLNQLTWRENYVRFADEALVRCFGKNAAQMSEPELATAMLDIRAYSWAYKAYAVTRGENALENVSKANPAWEQYSRAINPNSNDGARVFVARCTALLEQMRAAGYEFR